MKPEYADYIARLREQEDDDKAFIAAILLLFYKRVRQNFSIENYKKERAEFIKVGRPKILEHIEKSTAKTQKIVEDFYNVPAVSGEKQKELARAYVENALDIALAHLDNTIKTADTFSVSDGFINQWEGLVDNGIKKPSKP
jgi:hypothetical protein